MSDRSWRFRPDPETSDAELAAVGEQLVHSRPNPHPALRHRVRAVLPSRPPIGRPPHLWLRVALFAAAGTVLLLLIVAGIGNSGPFAA